jgi:integrase
LAVKKAKLAVLPYRHHPKYKFVLDLRAFGKGRKFFKTRVEADAEGRRQKTALERHGREAIALPAHELSDFIQARKTLADYGKTVKEATDFLVDHLERIRRCKTTVSQLKDEVIEAKQKDGRSRAYLTSLTFWLRRFSQDFGDQSVAAITVEDLDNYFRDFGASPKSRANFRANVGVLFSYAKQRRMIDSNPVEFTAKPKLPDNPPEIFTVDQLQGLLDAAQQHAPDVLPMLAIGAFTGLRDAEVRRLNWSEVNLARGFVEVKAAKAKSARRRLVPIQPNLTQWLTPYSANTGSLLPINVRKKLDAIRQKAGLTSWPKNGLRHSFASYRLAAIHDAPRVASELGHTSPAMLYNVYRELVAPEEAERYWNIRPQVAERENVLVFSATTVTPAQR